MKKTIVLLSVSFSFQVVFGQEWLDKYYGFPNTDQHFTAILETDDGGYLMGGTDGATNGNGDDIWLLKTDSIGNEIWTKHFGNTENNYLTEIAQAADGGYFLAGATFEGPKNLEAYLLKLNADYDIVWEITFIGSDESERVEDIEPTMDGGALVVTNDEYYDTEDSKVYKLDSTGAIEWELTKVETNIYDGRGIFVSSDNHYLYYGHKNGTGIIKVLDEEGNIVTTKAYYDIQHTDKMSIILASRTPQAGGYILYGISETGERMLTKIDEELNVTWQANFQFPDATYKIIELELNHFLLVGPSSLTDTYFANNTLETEFHHLLYEPAIDNVYDALINQHMQLLLVGLHRNSMGGEDGIAIETNLTFDKKWYQLYGQPGLPNNEEARALVKTPEGGYILGGTAHFPQTNSDFYLIKIDSSGEVEWEGNYGGTNAEATLDMALSNDGGVLLISRQSTNLLLLKVDSSGTQQWQKSYGDYDDLLGVFQVVSLPDDNFLIFFSGRNNGETGWTKVLKISSSGDSLGVHEIQFNYLHNRFTNAKLTSDGNVIAVGRSVSNFDGWVVKTDLEGNELFSFSLNFPEVGDEFLFGLTEATNGDYLVAGNLKEYDSLHVTRISPSGDILWHKIYSGASYYFSPLIERTSNGEYLVINVNSADKFQISRIDENGNLLESFENYKKDGFELMDSQINDNDQLALIFNGFNKNTEDIQFILSLPGGKVKTLDLKPLGHLTLSPNPSASQLNLIFESAYTGKLSIEIYNTSGQRLRYFEEEKQGEVFVKSYVLDTLPPESYFVRVLADGRGISRTWVKSK